MGYQAQEQPPGTNHQDKPAGEIHRKETRRELRNPPGTLPPGGQIQRWPDRARGQRIRQADRDHHAELPKHRARTLSVRTGCQAWQRRYVRSTVNSRRGLDVTRPRVRPAQGGVSPEPGCTCTRAGCAKQLSALASGRPRRTRDELGAVFRERIVRRLTSLAMWRRDARQLLPAQRLSTWSGVSSRPKPSIAAATIGATGSSPRCRAPPPEAGS
jgi:hypothetical protein